MHSLQCNSLYLILSFPRSLTMLWIAAPFGSYWEECIMYWILDTQRWWIQLILWRCSAFHCSQETGDPSWTMFSKWVAMTNCWVTASSFWVTGKDEAGSSIMCWVMKKWWRLLVTPPIFVYIFLQKWRVLSWVLMHLFLLKSTFIQQKVFKVASKREEYNSLSLGTNILQFVLPKVQYPVLLLHKHQ